MKLKSLLKVGLPILGVAALSISLPLALTSCSDSSDDEVNTTKESIQSAAQKIANLDTKKIGETENVVNAKAIADVITGEMGVGKKTIELFDIKPTAVPGVPSRDGGSQAEVTKSWDVIITLKGENKFDANVVSNAVTAQTEDEAADEGDDAAPTHTYKVVLSNNNKTLTLTIDNAKFANVAIEKALTSDEIKGALENIPAHQAKEVSSSTDATIPTNMFIEALEENTNNFIPSSIKTVTLKEATNVDGAQFFVLKDNAPTSPTDTLTEITKKYNATISMNQGFVFVKTNNQTGDMVVNNVVYKGTSVSLTKATTDKIVTAVSTKLADVQKDTFESAKSSIISELKQEVTNGKLWELLDNIQIVANEQESVVETTGTATTNPTATVTLVFKDNVQFGNINLVSSYAAPEMKVGTNLNELVISNVQFAATATSDK